MCSFLDQMSIIKTAETDWIRDIALLTDNQGVIITNFGHVLYFCNSLTVSPMMTLPLLNNVQDSVRSIQCFADKNQQMTSVVQLLCSFPYLLTCLSLPGYPLLNDRSSNFLEETNEKAARQTAAAVDAVSLPFLAVGTSCGHCCLFGTILCKEETPQVSSNEGLGLGRVETENKTLKALPATSVREVKHMPSMDKETSSLATRAWSIAFPVFDKSRVQKVFTFPFTASRSACYPKGYADFYVVVVTNHEGRVSVFWVNAQLCAETTLKQPDAPPTVSVPLENASSYGITVIAQTHLNQCSKRRDNRIYSCGASALHNVDRNNHFGNEIDHSIALCLGDEHGWLHFTEIDVVLHCKNR